jgi:Tol biopolymer transport system component
MWALDERRGFFESSTRAPLLMSSDALTWRTSVPSPNGQRMYGIGHQHELELVRYDASLRTFVPYLGGRPWSWVIFSRDGQWVAYIDHTEATIWRARADGTGAQQLTFAPMIASGHAWSPDGKRIAFRGLQTGGIWRIYVVSRDGGSPEALIPPGLMPAGMDEGIPAWSPDGRKIAFGEIPANYARGTGKEVIHIYDMDRRHLTALPQSEGLWTARWSPDGRYISALTIQEQSLMLFDTTTARWRALNTGPVDNPTWSSDGKFIQFNTVEESGPALFRVRIPDGVVERVTDLVEYRMQRGWSGVALDDAPLMLRHRDIEEIYALDLKLP